MQQQHRIVAHEHQINRFAPHNHHDFEHLQIQSDNKH
jgi:hypothetical protein